MFTGAFLCYNQSRELFMHFETMMFLLIHLAERLCEETENAD